MNLIVRVSRSCKPKDYKVFVFTYSDKKLPAQDVLKTTQQISNDWSFITHYVLDMKIFAVK